LKFDELYQNNIVLGNKIMAFTNYLQNSTFKGQARRTKGLLSNVENQTSNIEQRDRTSF